MFNLKKFIEALGISVIITIIAGFIIGFFEFPTVEGVIYINFIITYVTVGILMPLFNRKVPYTAAFLGAISMTLINIIFSINVLQLPIFVYPEIVNENLLASTIATMITAVIVVAILNRRETEAYD